VTPDDNPKPPAKKRDPVPRTPTPPAMHNPLNPPVIPSPLDSSTRAFPTPTPPAMRRPRPTPASLDADVGGPDLPLPRMPGIPTPGGAGGNARGGEEEEVPTAPVVKAPPRRPAQTATPSDIFPAVRPAPGRGPQGTPTPPGQRAGGVPTAPPPNPGTVRQPVGGAGAGRTPGQRSAGPATPPPRAPGQLGGGTPTPPTLRLSAEDRELTIADPGTSLVDAGRSALDGVALPGGAEAPGGTRTGSPTPGAQRAPHGRAATPVPGTVRSTPVTPAAMPAPEPPLEVVGEPPRKLSIAHPGTALNQAGRALPPGTSPPSAPPVPPTRAGGAPSRPPVPATVVSDFAPNPAISFDRILIIRLSALGDCIHALPAFHHLRLLFPQSKIAWAIEDRCASLLDDLPGLDHRIVFPRRELRGLAAKPWAWPGALARLLSIRSALRAFRPTVAFDFQGNTKSALHARLSGAPSRIGIADAKEGAERWYNFQVHLDGPVHRVERPLQLLRAAGIPATPNRPPYAVPDRDRQAIEAWLIHVGARRTVILHPGTSKFGAMKRWPVEKWSRLGDLLAADGLRTVIFAWGPGERGIAEAALAGMTVQGGVLGPESPRVPTLAALLRKASVFVGCDSGPLHLAALLGTPVIGLYGPKAPEIYGPYCENHVVIWKGLACSPCTRRDCAIPDCMNFIEPEEVARATEGLLLRIKSPAARKVAAGAGETLWASGEGWAVGKEEQQ